MLNSLRKFFVKSAPREAATAAVAGLLNIYATVAEFAEPDFPHVMHARRDRSDPELATHLLGFEGYVMAQGDGKMTSRRFHLLQHIARVRHHASLSVEPQHMDGFGAWAQRLNAVSFLPDGSIRDPQGRVLLSPGAGATDPEARLPYPPDAWQRKERTERALADGGMRVADLPPREGQAEAWLRSAPEVYARAQALLAVAVHAESARDGEPVRAAELLEKLPFAQAALSPLEREFLHDLAPTEEAITRFGWNYEALYALEWALGLVETMPLPDAISDAALATRVLLSASSPSTLRPTVELLDALDSTYRQHWIAVQARVKGEPATAGLMESVLEYRHRAFNWLVHHGGADWDGVTTPT